jgi:hypothetical protein
MYSNDYAKDLILDLRVVKPLMITDLKNIHGPFEIFTVLNNTAQKNLLSQQLHKDIQRKSTIHE